jgi:type II secretory pathway pseudopilin PulG
MKVNRKLTLGMNCRPVRDDGLTRYNESGSVFKGALTFGGGQSKRAGSPRAFTLIELIGVLAAIGLLAGALVPTLIRQMDRIAAEQESAVLKSCGDALQQSVMRKRYVPGTADWATNIAGELGVSISNVTTNGRQRPRFFLIDPTWQIGSTIAGEPYTQPTNGAALAANLRTIVLSSIGQPLTSMITGVPSTNDFNAIWDWTDGSSTPPSASLLAGFTRGEDLKVQRVNLSSLFVHLILTTNASTSKPMYSIDLTGSTNFVTAGNNGYFIRNSILFLYDAKTNIDSQRFLGRDTSFVYDQDVWRDSIGGRTGGGSTVAGLDFGSVIAQYLKAPENTNALNWTPRTGTNQQWIVVSNMMAYFDAYNHWATNQVAWAHDANYNAALLAQGALRDAVQDQYTKTQSGNDYVPRQYSDLRCP